LFKIDGEILYTVGEYDLPFHQTKGCCKTQVRSSLFVMVEIVNFSLSLCLITAQPHKFVILSEQSESKNLRIFITAKQYFGAKILRLRLRLRSG